MQMIPAIFINHFAWQHVISYLYKHNSYTYKIILALNVTFWLKTENKYTNQLAASLDLHKASKETTIKAPCFLIAVAAVDQGPPHSRHSANCKLGLGRAWKCSGKEES